MDAREDLPKVSIESEQDWRRIQQNLSTALLARLETELEILGQPGDKDALSPHAHQLLETVLDIARPNLRINGRTTDDPCGDEDDVEPFDEALDRHIWSLSDQRLKWDKEIADRRRSRPDDNRGIIMETLIQHLNHVCDLDVLSEPNTFAEINPKPSDPALQQTLLNAASLAPQLMQSIEFQQSRADRVKSVSAEVKAFKS